MLNWQTEADWPYRDLDNAWWAAQISSKLMNHGHGST